MRWSSISDGSAADQHKAAEQIAPRIVDMLGRRVKYCAGLEMGSALQAAAKHSANIWMRRRTEGDCALERFDAEMLREAKLARRRDVETTAAAVQST